MSEESSTTPTEQRLLPQLTLRSVLFWFTISIFAAWVIRQATLESQWAIAMVVAIAATAGFFLIYASLFLLVWLPAEMFRTTESIPNEIEDDSDDAFPPQLVPPRERNVAR